MHPKAERVQEALRRLGAAGQVRELPSSTRTATEAAAAVSTSVAQIAKSLVFLAGDQPVLAIASGANRVDLDRLGACLGSPVSTVDAKAVKQLTGYAAGGVPPVAHNRPLTTVIDADLERYEMLWAAAGTPHAVFPTTPAELVRLTGGLVAEIAERP